jgi:aldose 1-epimerase
MKITKKLFGVTPQGRDVFAYTLTNQAGASITLLDYGAILQSVLVPDQSGKRRDVVLGYDHLEDYVTNPNYFGATIGRNGNRIGGGEFTLQGRRYTLGKNENGRTNLHSGPAGFEKRLFQAALDEAAGRVTFSLVSPAGDQGFPGELQLQVAYEFTEDNVIRITYTGVSDQETVVNLTNHSYWNLNGAGSGSALGHGLQLEAEAFTPVDQALLPTGELRPVAGTPFDFTKGKKISRDLAAADPQLAYAGGYDHNFILRGTGFRKAATLSSPDSGIRLEVWTDQPGLQFYAGNGIGGPQGKGNLAYEPHSGVALETQHFPDAVHQPDFPSTVLAAGTQYHTVTEYRLGLD